VRRKVLSPLRCLTDNDIFGRRSIATLRESVVGAFLYRRDRARSESISRVLTVTIVKGTVNVEGRYSEKCEC